MHEPTWRGTWLNHGPAPRVAAPASSAPARRRDRHRALFEPSAQGKPGQRRWVGERAHVGCARQDSQAGPRQAAGERGHGRRGGYLVEFGRDQHDRNANGSDAIGPVVAGDGLERGCPRPAVGLLQAASRIPHDRAVAAEFRGREPSAERGIRVDRVAAPQRRSAAAAAAKAGNGVSRLQMSVRARTRPGASSARSSATWPPKEWPTTCIRSGRPLCAEASQAASSAGASPASAAGVATGHRTCPRGRRRAATPSQTAGVSGVPCRSTHQPSATLMHPSIRAGAGSRPPAGQSVSGQRSSGAGQPRFTGPGGQCLLRWRLHPGYGDIRESWIPRQSSFR